MMAGSVHFLDGGGEMGRAIRERDWSANPLGPPDGWPSALKIALGMALNSKFPKCIVWGPELVTLHNDAFRPILGDKGDVLGRSFADVWSEAWAEIGPIAERAYAGEATFIEDFRLVIDRYGYPEECHFTFCYSPIRDENGVVRGMIDTVIETTGKVEASRQLRLVNGELGHRIKNTLTVVSAIVNQTLHSHSGKDAREVLRQRIGALAQAQSLLTDSGALDAETRQVVAQALAPFRTGQRRFRIAGPPVKLSARQALTLALAINELATNALKYGALSVPTGVVDLSWSGGRPGSDDPFRLLWAESGGPPVAASAGKGFGSLIIEHVLAQDFMGESAISHDPAGLRCELRTRMRHLGAGHGAPG
ncbi:PAS domain-containing protein [Paracoccus denitrificans]|jgi:two-component sensor histidine kinase|nr:PAS domain-containing sensor histidine kinase [Paracoccus denitrificans]QAR25138.1 sensor histidine kinase [Paracoccus denitrificans]UPV94012.1 PAS domain-containing protein [Paracoccus denitrificans]GEK71173.1 histidine kinase [Paracoccus denitrificans]